jgi:predicted metal-dependent HD superfamily phosphohydrolase
LFAATLFHDVWLVPGAPDNEERSAAAAREHLRGLEFDFDYLDALIIATKLHALGSITDETTRRLVKADLSILWNPNPRTYAWYARGIRAEYALAPADAYQAGRTKLLRKFEAEIAPHIEPADAEMMSRNIAWEISMIEEGKIA